MMLSDKVAVVYGAGGAIGGAVARAMAAQGARVFATGRDREAVDAVAKEIGATGGSVEAATVDALDEPAIDAHLRYVVGRAGRVDISVNAAGPSNAEIIGVPLTELDPDEVHPADRGVHAVVLPDRPAGRPVHDPERSRSDHDHHRPARAPGYRSATAATDRRWRPRRP